MEEAREPLKARAHHRAWRRVGLRRADNDVSGHANDAVYFQWFDTAVNDWPIAEGLLDIGAGEVVGFVVEMRCRYARPFSYPGTVEIGLVVEALRRSSVCYRLGALAEGCDEPGAEARWTQVCEARERGERRSSGFSSVQGG